MGVCMAASGFLSLSRWLKGSVLPVWATRLPPLFSAAALRKLTVNAPLPRSAATPSHIWNIIYIFFIDDNVKVRLFIHKSMEQTYLNQSISLSIFIHLSLVPPQTLALNSVCHSLSHKHSIENSSAPVVCSRKTSYRLSRPENWPTLSQLA